MSLNKLTYRSGDKAYLKGGRDGAWEKAGGYDIIQTATKKLAMFEEREENLAREFNDFYALFKRLGVELLWDEFEIIENSCDKLETCGIITDRIIEKYRKKENPNDKPGLFGKFHNKKKGV